MTQTKKILKYVATALAALLTVSIVSAIYYGGAALIELIEGGGEEYIGELREIELDLSEFPSDLDVDIAASEFSIKIGEALKVETNNEHIECYIRKGTLYINEEDHKPLFSESSKKSVLTITLPKDLIFNEADIDTGAGRILIESLSAGELSLDLGAGETVIDSLNVSGEASISGGAGRIEIKHSEIGHLDVDHGVGELIITSLVKNGGEFDCGMGSVSVTLIGGEDDYSVNAEKGIGEIKICGRSVSNGSTYGIGSSRIEINGGVGAVHVDFSEA